MEFHESSNEECENVAEQDELVKPSSGSSDSGSSDSSSSESEDESEDEEDEDNGHVSKEIIIKDTL